MKSYIFTLYILINLGIFESCKSSSNELDILESEILSNTINYLTPDVSEIELIVPVEGGENSGKFEKRKKSFYLKHNRIIRNEGGYFILSNNLTIPNQSERYISSNGLPNSFVNFLFHTTKKKEVNCDFVKRIHNIKVKKKIVKITDFKTLNKPGCFGYIEYSRMFFFSNNTKAYFIFKYRLNNGMDITQFVTVKKVGGFWKIENREDLLVSHETANTPIEPTKIIDTLNAPKYDDSNFEIKFSSDINGNHSLPRDENIIVTINQNVFDKEFLKYSNFDFSIDRNSNDLENIYFIKLNDSTYKMKINKNYSNTEIEYDVRITPKRGYIYHDFLEASQYHRYVDHLYPGSLKVLWKSIDKIK